MAIILEGVDHSPVMWGKIGKHVVQRTKLGKMFIKIKVKPSNPKTQIQQEQRSALTEGILPDSGIVIDDLWTVVGIIPPYEPIPDGGFGTGKFG